MHITKRTADVVVEVTLSDTAGKVVESITATRNHPFYVHDKSFVPAGGLAVGNSIVTRAGPDVVVSKIEWKRQAGGFVVYNFEVEDDHTYFVGNTGVWVHNPIDCFGDLTASEIEKLQGLADEFGERVFVGGSAAKGTRRGLGTNLPLGKGVGTRSDLDIGVVRSGRNPELENAIRNAFPNDIDPRHGILTGPYMEDPIIFHPKP